MPEWLAVGIVVEGRAIDIGGLNPWKHEWHPTGEGHVELPHLAYPNQYHPMHVYEIEESERKLKFAAGELSPCVWSFYVPA